MRSALATRLVNASTGDHRRTAVSGLSLGTITRITGGSVCGGPVSNADDHPTVHGARSTRSPTIVAGRATATPGPSCPVRFGSGSPGARCVACLGSHSTSITSPPAPWAVRITRPTSGPCARRATTATGRRGGLGGRGVKVGGVSTATSNPQARVRVGGLFGFGGSNRFGGGLDERGTTVPRWPQIGDVPREQ